MSSNKNQSIGVAMSGGVDSSVTAALLKNEGYQVRGFFMNLGQPDLAAQVDRVRQVADRLKVELFVIDLADAFQQEVLDYFRDSYFTGRTPNPCMVCNREIKFGRLLQTILGRGPRLMATGHYARLEFNSQDHPMLRRGVDPKKDQSYFLARLTPEQLINIRFPLGEYTKQYVYLLAAELGLAGVHGRESQDVCFLKGKDLAGFLNTGAHPPAGMILDRSGQELGRHQGIHAYTVGQRRGLGLPDATPYYVLAIDPARNAVIVGKEEDLWQKELTVTTVNWLVPEPPVLPREYLVRIRYRHQPDPAVLFPGPDGQLTIRFKEPQRAVTPGQFAVFYDDDRVIGSSEII
ncbi:MAG: tRNA 2-thiouridine(34) synthase MnmA [Desulfobacterales bacterium]|nr:tRNA 2-thiouridine(34) synthase MnmA [Desulfobacterales bacterium]